MKKTLITIASLFCFSICFAQRDTTFTYDGKTVVANYTDTSVTFISYDGRQITNEQNAKTKSCITKMEEWCASDRNCRSVCMLTVVPPNYNPVCLLQWGIGCLIDSIF